ncbi:hypothetical protein LXL04_001089 [Taraxacum kok-saghyz]
MGCSSFSEAKQPVESDEEEKRPYSYRSNPTLCFTQHPFHPLISYHIGFDSVNRIAPSKIDSRLLRAVAIEHPKDADIAVEVVIEEVIPNLSQHSQSQSSTSSYSNKIDNSPSHSKDGGETIQYEPINTGANVKLAFFGKVSPKNRDSSIANHSSVDKREGHFGKITSCLTEDDIPITTGYITKQPTSQYLNTPEPHTPAIQESDPTSFLKNKSEKKPASFDKKHLDDKPTQGLFGQIAASLVKNDPAFTGCIQNEVISESVNIPEPNPPVTQEQDSGSSSVDKKDLDANTVNGPFSKLATCLAENDSHVKKQDGSISVSISENQTVPVTQEQDPGSSSKTTPENSCTGSVYEKVVNDNQDRGLFGQIAVTPSSSLVTTSESENNAVVVIEENTEDESVMNSKLTKSDQVCSIELLEDIIEEARNEKKTLVSTMDAVVELMREVEDKEKDAEEAKEEATRDCSHIFAKVDELKQALGRAKEANDMHAGEVYAEKAILATEMKELQVRLFTLSDERNKSLGILNEMHEALEIRLATALKEIMAAEAQKVEKEKSAREALAYQESRLEKVVEESKKLKREAEENSKLQEFLMDRGRAIDILQGEISVKCQDVVLLKEKFDKRIPLSVSLSSSQTSSILAAASPASSIRSHTTTLVAEAEGGEMYETPKKSLEFDDSTYSYSYENKTPWSHVESSPKQTDSWKLNLNDDDWELFDKGELSTSA